MRQSERVVVVGHGEICGIPTILQSAYLVLFELLTITSRVKEASQQINETTGTCYSTLSTVEELKRVVTLHDIAIGSKAIWQIQDSTGMATIHQTCHGDACTKGFDENLENVIVANLAAALEINGNQCFVIPVVFIAILISNATSVACPFRWKRAMGLWMC